jgi:hypothetical protein
MAKGLLEKFDKLKFGDIFLLDPDDFEMGSPIILGKYGHINPRKNLDSANIIYRNPKNNSLEYYKLLTFGNSLSLWSPKIKNEKRIPNYKPIPSDDFRKMKIYAEKIYFGREEIIQGLNETPGGMDYYAKLLKYGEILTELKSIEKVLEYTPLFSRFIKDPLKFSKKALKGNFI